MKIARFSHGGSTRLGVVIGEEIADLGVDRFPTDVGALLAGDGTAAAGAAASAAPRLPLAQVRLEAPVERALEAIAGFLVVDDVSVRDWQMASPTWTMGKSFDTHGPIGPWLVTPDEVGDPHTLGLRTWVNGDLRQDARTDDLVFDCFDQIAHLSAAFTLQPGTIVSTGTPSGVGFARTPPALLAPGDVVRIEIERIGVIEN